MCGLLTEDDETSSPNGNHPVFAQPSATGAVGSNPTPRTLCVTPRTPNGLSEVLSFGLWMQPQGYRESTIRPCVKALKAIGRRANLLDPEAAKACLARAELSEARKEKLVQDLARFYRYMWIPFEKPCHKVLSH